MKTIRNIRLFQITLGQYVFSPGLIASLVTFPLLYLMFSLGQWQLSRAEYKENLQQKIVERTEFPAVNMLGLPVSNEDRIYRKVKLTGSFDQRHSFLLDNQVVNGKVGYDVYTPYDAGSGQVMLVNRGFVELGRTRQRLPEIDTPAGNVAISGLMDKLPPKTLVLADNVNPGGQWPVVLQYVDQKELESMLGYPLLGMILRMDAGQSGVYEYHLPVLNLHSEKNRGYAFQRFAMMLALAIIYIVVNTKKRSISDE
jgi:surfeit locus 1 family protein